VKLLLVNDMGAIKELYDEVQSLLENSDFSIAQIAKELNVSIQMVNEIANELSQQESQDDYYVS
jgi:orotate phosphoribosyltransferase-like protein